VVDVKGLNYFIAMGDDPLVMSKEISALISEGWYPHDELKIFSAKDITGTIKIYYAQVMRKDTLPIG